MDTDKACILGYGFSENYILFRFIMINLIPAIVLVVIYLKIYIIIIREVNILFSRAEKPSLPSPSLPDLDFACVQANSKDFG